MTDRLSSANPDGALPPWAWVCPLCRNPLTNEGNEMCCEGCGSLFYRSQGIWNLLPERRALALERFMCEYRTVRADEGWGASHPEYFHALPHVARSDPQREIWRLRAISARLLLRRVMRPLEVESNRPLKILDLGAGNCWLSYRLAQRGHQVIAVDLSTDESDGLGAHRWFGQSLILPVRAEYDRLPLAGSQTDLVLFNASLHYSTDYVGTLQEALRVLKTDGRIVIMDSPVYREASSGEQMVRERETEFLRKYGFPSKAIPCQNFLTWGQLDELARTLRLSWDVISRPYRVRTVLRRWKAQLRHHREPAELPIIVGRRFAVPSSHR